MTATRPQPRPGVLDISPYIPGKSDAPGAAKVFKLSSNETPLGPGECAIAAYRAMGEHLEDYPDGSASALREAIGEVFGLDPARIVCGAGSDDLLNLIADAYLADGDEAIHTTHGFLVYPIATLGSGAKPIVAPETNYTADVDAILARVTERTKVVFLANPNNPTGTYVPFDEVKRLHQSLPPHVLLVLDAAYAEYVRRNDYEAGIELVATSDNVVMCRTFSKIYGMAGMRLGYAIAAPQLIQRMRPHSTGTVNALVKWGGVAALRDTESQERIRRTTLDLRKKTTTRLEALGYPVIPSQANFFMVHIRRPVQPVIEEFRRRGVLVGRPFPPMLEHLRVSVGTPEEMERFMTAFGAIFPVADGSGG